MDKIFVNFLPPWVETNIQPAFYDKESGSVLQQTARMYAKVNCLVRMFNKLSKETKETVEDYIARFVSLKDFVDTYFENLDVQEEINNKLDAMVEDGTLQEIITTYIQANVAWTFDTVADMQASTNLIEGSYARTIGYYSANDGGGALYKIKSSTGVTADEAFIVTVNADLVAEMVIENDTVNFRQLGAKSEEDTSYAHTDCKTYLDKFLAKLDTITNKTISLFIPTGIWCFSETLLNRTHGFNIYGEKSFVITTAGSENSTIIAPVSNNQKHIWKIGGTSDYSETAQTMVYSWNINNLIFSTAEYSTGRAIVTLKHVTKAALYLDGVTAGRSEFMQFDQVDGTALSITSSWENYFGTLNFRRVYDFNTPAFHFVKSHPITGATSPDISSTDIKDIMFEGINGDMIYSDNDSDLAELQIGNMNVESRLVQETGTEQGTIITNNSSKTADNHCAVFNFGRALGIMINQIKLGNFCNYKFTSSDTGQTYINDRLFTLRENSFFQVAIDKIICNGSRALLTLCYKPSTYMVNMRSRMVINTFECYSEIIADNYPLLEVEYFPQITVTNIVNGMGTVREGMGTIPLYKYAITNGSNQYLYYDAGSDNPLKLALRRKTTMAQTLCALTANNNYDIVVRIKAKTGVTGRIGYRATPAGGSETYYSGPFYTGDDKWQNIKIELPALEEGTRLVLADGYSGYADDSQVTIFDSVSLVPKAS